MGSCLCETGNFCQFQYVAMTEAQQMSKMALNEQTILSPFGVVDGRGAVLGVPITLANHTPNCSVEVGSWHLIQYE